jgi:hypothetical protein
MDLGTWPEDVLEETGHVSFSPFGEYTILRRSCENLPSRDCPKDILGQIKAYRCPT